MEDLKHHLTLFSSWAKKWHIQINPNKSQAKIFTLRRPDVLPNLTYQNQSITWLPHNKTVKYLGVLFDKRLTWQQNIKHRIALATSRVHQLYPILKKSSPLQLHVATHLYKAMIRPILSYASPIWAAAAKTNINKIQIFQNRFLRTITKAPWYIPNAQLHIELGITPIPVHFSLLAAKFYPKILKIPSAIHFHIGKQNPHRKRLKRKLPREFFDPP